MTALAIIGFIVLCVVAVTATVVFVQVSLTEIGFTGKAGPVTFVFGIAACGFWVLAWWLCPFTVTFGVSA
jgi:hypothetical protein